MLKNQQTIYRSLKGLFSFLGRSLKFLAFSGHYTFEGTREAGDDTDDSDESS